MVRDVAVRHAMDFDPLTIQTDSNNPGPVDYKRNATPVSMDSIRHRTVPSLQWLLSSVAEIAMMPWNDFLCATLLAFLPAVSHGQTLSRSSEPIRLDSRNPHYFFFHGKTIALITSGEHYGAVLNADFDYRKYLDTLQSDGLNYTRLFPGSYVEVPEKSFGIRRNDLAPAEGRFNAPWTRSSTPGYAGGGNKFDLDRWNAEYFARLHDFLSEAAKRGIVVEISLFSSQYGEMQWALSPFNPANNVNGPSAIDRKLINTLESGNILAHQERYTRKLVREVSAFDNVIFELQNEPFATDRFWTGSSISISFPLLGISFPTPSRQPTTNRSHGRHTWRNGSRAKRSRCRINTSSHRTIAISDFQ